MDGLTFFSQAIASLAWPAAAVVIVFVLRKSIEKLIPMIRSLRIRDIEVEFGQELARVRDEVEEADELPAVRHVRFEEDPVFTQLQLLAATHPPAAIIEAWKVIEGELRELADLVDRPHLKRTPAKVFSEMRKEGRFGPNVGKMFNQLRHLRNKAAHESDLRVTEGQAVEYVDLAQSVAAFIKAYGDKKRN